MNEKIQINKIQMSNVIKNFKNLIKEAYKVQPQKILIALLVLVILLLLVQIGVLFFIYKFLAGDNVWGKVPFTFYDTTYSSSSGDAPMVTIKPETQNDSLDLDEKRSEFYPNFSKPAISGKFVVEDIHINEPGYFGDPGLKSFIRLGDDILKVINLDPVCSKESPHKVPRPVVNKDKTKVYYVDPHNPTQVMEIDTNKEERVYFVAPGNYKYIAAMVINSKNELSYTLLQDPLIDCSKGENYGWYPDDIKSAFYVNYKLLPYQISKDTRGMPHMEYVVQTGDSYFLTRFIYGLGGGAVDINLRRISDGSMVSEFKGAWVRYELDDYVIVESGLGDGGPVRTDLMKVNLKSGEVNYILSDKYIFDVKVKDGNKLIISYGIGKFSPNYEYGPNDNFKFEGEEKVLEYEL